jgi:hypothetical protein
MGKNITAMGVLSVLLCDWALSQGTESIELAFTGDFFGAGPFPQSGQGWYAGIATPIGLALAETRIEVSKVPNPCSGTATRISAVDVNEALFLVRGSRFFLPGPLDSVFDDRRFIYPAEGFSLLLQSGKYFGFQAYGSATPGVGGVRVSDYEIRMYQGTRTQTLAEFPVIDQDGPPQLVWAGDLDRDGNLDALLDLTTSYAGNLYVLFLSSAARNDQLVERVAEFPVGGC